MGVDNPMKRLARHVPVWVLCLLGVDLLLGVANVVTYELSHHFHYPQIDLFRLSGEENIPTWWSSAQLLMIALCLAILAAHLIERHNPRSWTLLLAPALFLFLSMDEVAQFHERIGAEWGPRNLRTGMWVMWCAPAFIIAVAIVARALWPYLRPHRLVMARFGMGIAMLLACAVGLEMLANLFPDRSMLSNLEVIAEEVGEMMAGTLMLWAAATWLAAERIVLARRLPSAEPQPRIDTIQPAAPMAETAITV